MIPNPVRRAMVCLPVTGLADLTLEHLLGVVGRDFRTSGGNGRPVVLKLVSVTDMRPRRRFPPDLPPSVDERGGALEAISALGLDDEPVPVGPRRIGLLFQGPSRPRLVDDYYDLELPWLPLPGLHLSPLESDPSSPETSIFYEAVID